ncbi:hypothetical protein FHL15_006936 [Xylaria flabelliformis]|uniref:Uncharacterized protein n=1 Tax=Xylaria flabelliformis TaxID=2512241 RepID=A0A553HVU5_9PEZI|nr:hypothetical protein FHL15_006936 [Xylaria flabelliformis]
MILASARAISALGWTTRGTSHYRRRKPLDPVSKVAYEVLQECSDEGDENRDIVQLLNALKIDVMGFDKRTREDLKALDLPHHADEFENPLTAIERIYRQDTVRGQCAYEKTTAFATILECVIEA